MKNRNTKIHEFQLPFGSKVLCAKFGNQQKSILASGDNQNNINLWKINKDQPLITLNHSGSNSNTQVEVTSILFNYQDTEVYSGSNRGIINIWDVNKQKISSTLKGHTTGVSALSIVQDTEASNILVSGSYDCSIKVWDVRQKSVVKQFKGHQSQINSIDCSINGSYVLSGSSDGVVKVWDINTNKCLHTSSLHEGPVNCVKFNPQEMVFASAGSDKKIQYWDLQSFQLVSTTKPDTTGIQQMLFSEDGQVLFSAAHESLKVWNLEKDGLQLDNVQTQWRGIQDMTIYEVDDMLLGLSAYQQQFSLWACLLKQVNMDENSIKQNSNIYSRQQQPISSPQQQQQYVQQFKVGSYAKQHSKPVQSNINQDHLQQNINEIIGNINMVNQQMQNLENYKQVQQYQQQHQKDNIQNQQDNQILQQISVQEEQLKVTQKNLMEQLQKSQINYQQQQQQSQQQQDQNSTLPRSGNNLDQYQQQQQQGYSYQQQQQNGLDSQQQVQHQQEEQEQIQQNQMQLSQLQEQYRKSSASKDQDQEEIIEENIQVPQFEEETKKDDPLSEQLSKSLHISQVQQSMVQQNKSSNYQQQQQLQQGDQLVKSQVVNEPIQQQQQSQCINNNINDMDQSSLTIAEGNFTMSMVCQGSEDQEKYQQFDVIGDTLKEHQKFSTILGARINYMKPILHWWSTGNIKSALQAINQLTDTSLLMDALNMSLQLGKIQYLNIEGVSLLIQKAKLLIESKYFPHIQCGLQFTQQILNQYKEEIINIKTFHVMGKVDLAREERIQSYNKLLQALQVIHQLPRLKRIAEKGPKNLGDLGKKLYNELNQLMARAA